MCVCVYIYIKRNSESCRDVARPSGCHTEQSEVCQNEENKYHINVYTWNLEKYTK